MKCNRRPFSNDAMWIYGKHAVEAAILNPKREIIRLVILESSKEFLTKIKYNGNEIIPEIVDKNFFITTFGKDSTHQGCAVFVKKLPEMIIEDIICDENNNNPVILLDQITDPQNIGSILRAAAVFGARAVILTENNTPKLTSSISKSASGALETVPIIRVINLVQTINTLKNHGFWAIGLDEKSEKSLNRMDLKGKFMFIIGSEGDGMRSLTRKNCDFLVKLPWLGNFTTLNAAQAATISLYESLRQRENNG
jgi:23S rRNA (guanosine2251-2'-O)-methyltransferase